MAHYIVKYIVHLYDTLHRQIIVHLYGTLHRQIIVHLYGKYIFPSSKNKNESFKKTLKIIGPKVDPCGIPNTALMYVLYVSFIRTACFLQI